MSLEGMDVGQVQRLAGRLHTNARALADIAAGLTGLTAELGRTWLGPASAAFQQQWTTQHHATLNSAAQALTDMHTRVMANIQQQIRASTAESWSTAGEPHSAHHGLLSDFERYAADAGVVGFTVGKDLLYQPFASLVDDVTKGPWTLARWSRVLEDASSVLGVVSLVLAPIPGVDLVDTVLVIGAAGFSAAAAVTEGFAVAEHEQGASVTNVVVDAGGAVLPIGGRVIGQGLKTARLADGSEAEVTAKSVVQSGIKHFLRLPDSDSDAPALTVRNLVASVKDRIDSDLHLGAEPGTGASQQPFEHAKWGMDQADHALDVLDAQRAQKGGGS